MRIIAKSRLQKFWKQKQYQTAEQPLRAWHDEVSKAEWKSINDIKATYPKASIVGNNRIVFDIMGGAFRLIVKVEFKMNAIFIRFFGTHKEYDKIKASEV